MDLGSSLSRSRRVAPALLLLSLQACGATRSTIEPTPSSDELEAPRGERPVLTGTLEAGQAHACAIEAGQVFCWGAAEEGALGEEPMRLRFAETGPPFFVRGVEGAEELAAGASFTCARHPGAVTCWGEVPEHHAEALPRSERRSLEDIVAEAERARLSALEGWQDVVDIDASGGVLCGVHDTGGVSCLGSERLRAAYQPPLDARGRIEGIDDARSVSVGAGHVCVLSRTQRVACTGTYGLSGDRAQPPPLRPLTALSDIVALTSGGSFACALDESGTVRCWGEVPWADDAPTESAPEAWTLERPARAIAANGEHLCALTAEGAVWCRGSGFFGELGDGSAVDHREPVQVHGLSDAIEITAGAEFSCARRGDGSLVCWGRADQGQLGTREAVALPLVTTVDGVTDAIDIELGDRHACALRSDGRVLCWGNDNHGQLGDGPGPWRRRAARVVDGLEDVADLSLGSLSSCALTRAGGVSCWGRAMGEPSGGAATVSDVPVPIEAIPGARAIAVGADRGCAIDGSGVVSCWGESTGTTASRVPRLSAVAAIAIQEHGFRSTNWALGADGTLSSWGEDPRGPFHPFSGARPTEVSCGDERCCFVDASQTIGCWDERGEASPAPPLSDVRSVRCDGASCCAIASGNLSCWGGLGVSAGEFVSRIRAGTVDEPVALPALQPIALGVGRDFLCWVEGDGTVRCWGSENSHGELGAITSDVRTEPVPVAAPTAPTR